MRSGDLQYVHGRDGHPHTKIGSFGFGIPGGLRLRSGPPQQPPKPGRDHPQRHDLRHHMEEHHVGAVSPGQRKAARQEKA